MFSIQLESFGACIPEIRELIPLHHKELAAFQDKMPLAPNWELYLAREARGELVFISLRRAGRMVGYFIAFMAYGLHYGQTMTVTMDIVWVHPDYRNRGHVIKMLDFAIAEFTRRGANLLYTGSKVGSSLHAGLERVYLSRGFEPIDLYYGRWLSG